MSRYRTPSLLKVALAATVTVSLLAVPAAPAQADDGPTPSRDQVAGVFGMTTPEWAPQGTLIADSGFDPAYDSFPFANYGDTLGAKNALLGYPADQLPVNLTNQELQRIFGSKVACTFGKDADCVANPVVAAWGDAVSLAMTGGHCFGFAALVAGLFDGVISRAGLTPSAANVGMTLSPAVQRQIAQWFATQFFIVTDPDLRAANWLPPDQIVNQLVEFLPSGTLPYVLAMNTAMGGHAVTPYAVYSRGPDLVDIAVYDNNWPLQARAIHVNLATNTWEYQMAPDDGTGKPWMWGSDIANELLGSGSGLGLTPLAQLTGTHACTFCAGSSAGSSTAVVSIRGNPSKTTVDVSAPDGGRLPGVTHPEATDGMPDFYDVPASAYRVRTRTPNASAYEESLGSYGSGATITATRLGISFMATLYQLFAVGEGAFPTEAAYWKALGVQPDWAGKAEVVDTMTSDRDSRAGTATVSGPGVLTSLQLRRDRANVDFGIAFQPSLLVSSEGVKADGTQDLESSVRWLKASIAFTRADVTAAIEEVGDTVVITYRGDRTTYAGLQGSRISPATGYSGARLASVDGVRMAPGDKLVVDIASWKHGGVPVVTKVVRSGKRSPVEMTRLATPPKAPVATRPLG